MTALLRSALLLIASGVFVLLAACGGGGDEAELLAGGDYAARVSGTMEIELADETASAGLAGQARGGTSQVSGDVTLKMGDDGSFSLEEWGISGTVQVAGVTVIITASDSPNERSTGKSTLDGSTADVYWQVTASNSTTQTGSNDDTIGMSGDPLLSGATAATLRSEEGKAVAFLDEAGGAIVRTSLVELTLELGPAGGGGETPEATQEPTEEPAATPTEQPTEEPQKTPTEPAEVSTARLEQQAGCGHTQPGVQSDLLDLIIAYLESGAELNGRPGGPPRLVLALALEGSGDAVARSLGAGQPLEGVTIFAKATGPGVLVPEQSAVTDDEGAARLRFAINRFGDYTITVGAVIAPDSTYYGFSSDSELVATFTVGETCELPPGF